jgi:hypothetical protein
MRIGRMGIRWWEKKYCYEVWWDGLGWWDR